MVSLVKVALGQSQKKLVDHISTESRTEKGLVTLCTGRIRLVTIAVLTSCLGSIAHHLVSLERASAPALFVRILKL